MDAVYVVDAAAAAVVFLAWAWPLSRSIRAAALDAREAGLPCVAALSVVGAIAVCLRLWAFQPTYLFSLPDAHHFMEKVAHPLLNAGWHPYHLGGYVLFAGLERLFGDGPGVIWTTNALAGALSAVLLFPLVLRLSGRPSAALLASFLLAVHAPSVRVDSSEQFSTLSVLAAIVAWQSVADVARDRSWRAVLPAGIALAALAQLRLDALAQGGFAVLTFFLVPGARRGFRAARPLLASVAVAAVLAVPRIVSTAHAILGEWSSGGAAANHFWSVETTRRLLFSDRSVFVTVPAILPVYPLLLLAGLGALAWRREWRLLAFFSLAVLFAVLGVHGWTLDLDDALRFQDVSWFPLVAVAGIGADAVARVPASRAGSGLAATALCLAAVSAFVAAWPLLAAPQAFDRSDAFFRRHVTGFPADCRLLLPRSSPRPPWGPGSWPRSLLEAWPGVEPRFFPEDLAATDPDACRIAFLGIECYVRYPSDAEVGEWPADALLFDRIDGWKRDMDGRGLDRERDECRTLKERYVLEPLVTGIVEPGRPTFAWLPPGSLEIGFYRLGAHR